MSGSLVLHELIGTLTIGAFTIVVLLTADVLKRYTSIDGELTRKLAHIGSGISLLLIPVLLSSSWTVLILISSFAVLLLVTHLAGVLQGVHGVGRGVGGSLWYPITAWLLYVIVFDVREDSYLTYAIPVLVLACADAMGAVVGRLWGRRRYEVIPGHYRTIEGSLAFTVTALVCIVVPLTVGMHWSIGHALAVGALVATIAAMFEAVSVHGIDNLLVPMSTLLFLDLLGPLDGGTLALQALIVAGIAIVALLIAWRRPATGGALTSFVLSTYTILVLGGWTWMLPLAGLVVAFVLWERLAPMPREFAKSRYEMGTTMIGMTIPVVLVLLAAAADDRSVADAIFLGYIASIASQAAILFYMLPQHRTFRLTRLRRVLTVKDPWQHAPTVGKVLFAACGAVVVLAAPVALLDLSNTATPRPPLVSMLTVAGLLGLGAFITIAATSCARRTCAACGNVTLHGMGCCHLYDLGVGETVTLRTTTFRTSYLAATTLAATSATLVVLLWS